MKRKYTKPTIHAEAMAVEMPLAQTCQDTGDAFELRLQGWFISEQSCMFVEGSGGDDHSAYGDSICYHSNIITSLSS